MTPRRSSLWFSPRWLLLSLLWPAFEPAHASDRGAGQDPAAQSDRRPLFPLFRKRARRDEPPPPAEAPAPSSVITKVSSRNRFGPDPDAPAAEPPADPPDVGAAPEEGIWDWIDRMEGEIPSPEQVAAVAEVTAEKRAELSVTDELAGGEAPVRFYEDPAAALAVDPLALAGIDPSEFDIPVESNPAVEKWIRYFTGPGRQYYEKWLARAPRYQPMMRRELAKAGLPQDLVYLSMIESGYNPHAYSAADAAGLWQFIPSTGRVYDLRIDWWVDDRRDPERSLGAAITFLGELHRMFGDWRLAWASYNGGPGRVRRAIQKSESHDFWQIAEGSWLHPETENYVPKIMAAAIIGKHPERYGFAVPKGEPLAYDVVDVSGSVTLEVLARCADATVDELKALNPGLRRYATPPQGYPVRVPAGRHDTFVAALAAVPAAERSAVVRHTVGRGETLSTIAARYGTTVEALSSANQLENVDRIVVGMSLVVPPGEGELPAERTVLADARPAASGAARSRPASEGRPNVVAAAVSPFGAAEERAPEARPAPRPPIIAPSRPEPAPAPPPTRTHTVSQGETLSSIASRYESSAAELQSLNGLSSTKILVGQKLAVPGTADAPAAGGAAPLVHVVQKGEWLASIAARYDVSIADLSRWNQLRDASHIEVGQKLSIHPGPGARDVWIEVVVERGDSLSKLAERNGCTVAQLQEWNDLGGRSVIHPGQKLRVRK